MTKIKEQAMLQDLSDCSQVTKILTAHNIGYWKNLGGTDKQKCEDIGIASDSHSYGPVYEYLLSNVNKKQKSCILEIGVQYGGSMLLWHDYCPNSFVIGVDIENRVHDKIKSSLKFDRHALFIADAYSQELINKIKDIARDGIDLMIDDGPHTLHSQCAFLRLYLPLLSATGVAVIEDIQEPSWFERLESEIPEGYVTERIDRRKVNGRWDDLMLVISKIA